MSLFENRKVVVIGDRDGIPGPAIDECLKTAGAEIVFSSTECFV
jgi:betaine reductase